MNAKFFIGFATLSGFLSHNPRVVYYSLSSQTRHSKQGGFTVSIWECELMLQYLCNEGQVIHYCLMRQGSALDAFVAEKERLRRRALTAQDAVKAILSARDIQAIEARIATPTDLERLNADFDLLRYEKESDSFSPVINEEVNTQ